MEHNVFRDYCKAENSDDEQDNCDLQSQLYAEIYYGSNNVDNLDAKEIFKVETPAVDNEQLRENTNTDKAVNSVDGSAKSNFGGSSTGMNVTNDSMNNSILPQNYDKSNVEIICASNEIKLLPADDKNNLNIPRIRVLNKDARGSIGFSTDNTQSVVSHNVESTKSNSDVHIVHDTSTPAPVKLKTEEENKEELRSIQSLNVGIATTTTIQSDIDPEKCNIDNNMEKIEEKACIKPKVDDSCDIFKKYEFSKLFINKLYLEKYENIEKRLQELEEEKEKCLRDREREKMNVREKEVNQRREKEQTEKDTRYSVLTTNVKAQKANNESEKVTLLSDTESDSEESILEVPIPPKPQPPVINLQDSDEGSDSVTSDDEDSQDCFIITQNKDRLTKEKKRKTCRTEGDSRNASSIQEYVTDALVDPMTEDIMLNCTEVQKGASTIKEIVEMRKDAQNISEQCFDKDKDTCEKNKSVSVSELHNKTLSKTDKSLLSVNENDSNAEFQLPLKTVNKRNIVYERDKSKSVSFANEVTVTIFQNPKESSSSKKRIHEDDNEPCTSAKQRKTLDDENKHGKSNAEQCEDKNRMERGSWEEYFFRPMSDTLKTFYNESRGQENFDVQDIQSEMSNDDLMPNLSRQRFWNVTCNNCHRKGHLAHSCPEPRKPPRCHICGIEGHTESRCPQKMCLTCGKKQGTFRKTCESCRTLYCEMCKAVGHKSTECPDHWRRFHQTTRNSKISVPGNLSEVMKPADSLYCCNCTKRGHDSSTCHEYRWSQHFPTPAFVSNYTDEPECQDPSYIYVNSNDMIPLSKKAAKKMGKLRKVSFPSGNDIPQCCQVLYGYGSFQTKKANGEEIFKNAPGAIVDHITTFLQGRNSTAMLDKISKLVKFEVKIFRNPHKVLMLRVRTVLNMSEYVLEIFLYWFQLSDEDKRLRLDVSLPRELKNMQQFLTTKWQAFKKPVEENPRDVHKEIQFLKVSLANIHDTNTLSSISRKIVELEGKLVKMYHMQPKLSSLAARLEQAIRRINKSLRKEKNGFIPQLKHGFYIHLLIIYNKLSLPRTLTDKELQSLFDSYTQLQTNENNKGKENKGSKKHNRGCNLFEKFVKNIQLYNLRSGKQEQRKEKCASTSNKTKQLPEDAQIQGEQIPAMALTTACSSSYICEYNENTPNLLTEDIPLDYYNTEASSANWNTVYPIEVVQLPRSQRNIPITVPVENPVQKADRKSLSHNLISIPLKMSARASASSQHLQKAHLSSMPCPEIRPEGIREKQPEIINNSSGTVKSSTSQENDTTSSAKKKKSKKEKKKQSSEDEAQSSENQVGNVDVSVESTAAKVINEAIAFNLPYMNKVVEEVKKRITDKNIKQEHIDMLQRLINLEKDHRQYVTSFCNYLH
ncbi:uncharacterized protein LOC143378399 isoform X2 [Andrena cerasifolii]|uniref:uncharacterized protein LOC143378399 isoform X2 n=1 Tax=Andrena cerasifolii TaxID=2819439 RepID=UPI0040376EC5